ncbi:MAG: AAA family ATPase [Vampirovibrionales bacterium]
MSAPPLAASEDAPVFHGSASRPHSGVAQGPNTLGQPMVTGCIEFLTADSPVTLPPGILLHWGQQLTERIESLGGVSQTIQPGVLWFGFGHQEPAFALRRALKVVWPLLQQTAQYQGTPIPMRMALSLDDSAAAEATPSHPSSWPDVFTCRAQAKTGQCVLPPALGHLLPHGMATTATPSGLLALVPPVVKERPSPIVAPAASSAPHAEPTVPSSAKPSGNTPASSRQTDKTPPPPPPAVLSQPATPPTIPEVVLQRFSAPLPHEPASSELPVYSDLLHHPTPPYGAISTPTAKVSAEAPPIAPVAKDSSASAASDTQTLPLLSHRELSELMAIGTLPSYFTALSHPPAPTHRYAECPTALLQAVQSALQQQHPHVISLTGPSGIGKSVWVNHGLLSQLVPNPQEPALVWFSSQAAHGSVEASQPLSLWLDCFQRAIPVSLEGGPKTHLTLWITQSVQQVFRDARTLDTHRQCLEMLLHASAAPVHGASSTLWGESPPPRLLNTLAEFFSQMAQQLPVVMVIDDSHRMDGPSLALLAHLLAHPLLQQSRVVVVLAWPNTVQPSGILAQTLYTLAHPPGGGSAYTALVCDALSASDFQGLIEHGPFQGIGSVVSHSLLDRLYAQSQAPQAGQLLYLSEALTWLHAQGVFQASEKEGHLVANPNVDQTTLAIPPTLPALLQERLRWLSAEQADVLGWCATFGERFSVSAVQQLTQQMSGLAAHTFQEALHSLAAQQWLLTDFQQSGQFRHTALWSALYHHLPDVADRHQAVAQWLTQQAQQGVSVSPGLLAHHWAQAQQGAMARPQWLSMAATAHYLGSESGTLLALHNALTSLQHEAAVNPHLNNAQTAEALQLLQAYGTVLSTQHPTEAAQILPTVVTYAQHRGEVGPWLDSLSQCLVTFDRIGHWQGALETLDQLLASLPPQGDPTLRAVMEGHRLRCLVALGQYHQAEQLGQQSVLEPLKQAARQPQSPHWRLWHRCLLAQASIGWRRCQLDSLHHLQSLQRAVKDDPELYASVLLERVTAQLAVGPYTPCEDWLKEAHSIIETLPDQTRLKAQWGLARMMTWLHCGQPALAHPWILETLQLAEDSHDHSTWIETNNLAGWLDLVDNRPQEAHDVFEKLIIMHP